MLTGYVYLQPFAQSDNACVHAFTGAQQLEHVAEVLLAWSRSKRTPDDPPPDCTNGGGCWHMVHLARESAIQAGLDETRAKIRAIVAQITADANEGGLSDEQRTA